MGTARFIAWVVLGMMLLAGCRRRVTYYEPPPIDGLRFTATAEITRPERDSLRVRAFARNNARTQRQLERGVCNDPVAIRLYDAEPPVRRPGSPIWDSIAWRRAAEPPTRVCVALLEVRYIPSGDSAEVAVVVLPIRVILGDSLASGAYRVSARLDGSGWRAGEIDAGMVDLRPPSR